MDRTLLVDAQGIQTHRHTLGDGHSPALTTEGGNSFEGSPAEGRGGRQRCLRCCPDLQGGRLAIQPTLGRLPTKIQQGGCLGRCLHTLRHRGQAQPLRQADQGLGQPQTLEVAIADRTGEGAIELDAVDRQIAQVADRGEAGAEVVDPPAHAQICQAVDQLPHPRGQGEEVGFGDLQMEAFGANGGLLKPLAHPIGQIRVAEGGGGDIGGHKVIGRQGRQGSDAAAHHPQIDLHRQVAAEGRGKEGIGHRDAAIASHPAHQGLVTAELAAGQIHHGHEPRLEGIGLKGLSDLGLQRQGTAGFFGNLLIGQNAAVPPLGGRLSHRQAGIAEQLIGALAGLSEGQTDAHRGFEQLGLEGDRALAGQAQPIRHDAGLDLARAAAQQHQKGVAGAAGHQIGRLHNPGEPGGEGGDQPVTGPVGEGIVHLGEAINADAEQRQGTGGSLGPLKPFLQPGDQHAPAGQAAEGIGAQGLLQLAPQLHLRPDIPPAADHTGRRIPGIEGPGRDLHPTDLPLRMEQPHGDGGRVACRRIRHERQNGGAIGWSDQLHQGTAHETFGWEAELGLHRRRDPGDPTGLVLKTDHLAEALGQKP